MSWLPDWLTGFDREAYEEGRRADERNRAITDNLHDRGLISDDDYAVAQQHYDDAAAYNPDQDIANAFGEGLDEGASNIRAFGGNLVNTVVGTPLKIIPWQLWVAGGLYLAWRAGLLKNILPKK